jgi:ribosomal protein L34E
MQALENPQPHEPRSSLRRSLPIASAQAASSASTAREGLATDFIEGARGGARSVENCFCGVNARRRSTAEQVKHLNERCSYPGALMILAGTISSKRIVAPHTTQRIATTHSEPSRPMGTLGCPSCQADAMRLCETFGIGTSRRNVSGRNLNDKPILLPAFVACPSTLGPRAVTHTFTALVAHIFTAVGNPKPR